MNILIFSTVFFPGIGGIENQTLLLVNEFVKKGHTVKVITSQKQTEPLKDIEVYYRPGIFKSKMLFLWCTTLYMPNISLKGVWLLFLNPKKTWVISHNDFSSCNRKGAIPWLKNFAHKFASQNIAVSKSIAEFLAPSAAVVYNCYDNSTFKKYEDEERNIDFVFLGRLVSQKGCELLIKACSQLEQPFTLKIIGVGPEQNNLKQLTKTLGLNNSIKFTGILTGDELARTLNQCRTMVVPSLESEGFGMVVLEGLACGCSIIAAGAGGLVEAIGPYGQTFSIGNQTELSKLLEDSILKKESLRPDNLDLKKHLKKHSKSVVSDNYLKFFT